MLKVDFIQRAQTFAPPTKAMWKNIAKDLKHLEAIPCVMFFYTPKNGEWPTKIKRLEHLAKVSMLGHVEISTLGQVNMILEKSRTRVPLRTFVETTIHLLKKQTEFSAPDRYASRLITYDINRLYRIYDRELAVCSPVTKIIILFRSVIEEMIAFCSHYKTSAQLRREWEGDPHLNNGFQYAFRNYTQEQYEQTFPMHEYLRKTGKGIVMEEIVPEVLPCAEIEKRLKEGRLTQDQALFTALVCEDDKEAKFFKKLFNTIKFKENDPRLAHLMIVACQAVELNSPAICHIVSRDWKKIPPQGYREAYLYLDGSGGEQLKKLVFKSFDCAYKEANDLWD